MDQGSNAKRPTVKAKTTLPEWRLQSQNSFIFPQVNEHKTLQMEKKSY